MSTTSAEKLGEVSSHEVGHTVGLSHDGNSSTSYYSGHGNWAPIMGSGYNRNVTQWSKGEYANANQLQNDLTIITVPPLATTIAFAPEGYSLHYR